AGRVVCVTRPGDGVADRLPEGVEHAEQREGEGTAAAMLAAREHLEGAGTVLTLSGDHPLIPSELVRELAQAHAGTGAAATLLTTEELEPAGYGRIVRAADGSVERIVETKSTEGLAPADLAIREVNLGTYAFAACPLLEVLDTVGEERGERYLTAVFPLLRERGHEVAVHPTRDTSVAAGVNTRAGLMEVEAVAHERIVRRHALAGVGFRAPATVAVDADVEIGPDTEIGPGAVLRGATRIGAGCHIGPYTTIADSEVGDGASVVHSHLVECRVENGAAVGPFSYLRPGAHVGERAKVGAFCEVKNSRLGPGAKVPHLSYVGDADVGAGSNLGASTITANYDGRRKHRTVIGERARTGVHTSLVAPVHVGDDAYTGAGSVVTEEVPDGALGIARPEQRNVEGYAERVKEREP
ncbi:MAG TPA: bifunctional UDP-N-acetylglucosamine diphosphorylase/glucosamine-1-phosphate N-acetyltransferase GlmU, partial [Thermoleophilaceae bacterium]|nr:bifunctional UDP-N-acetylglucosamine diphosphorylase/glucosamine-1-phosphate N-acetyltransferase GlmU [Thermoleophilaceae bacterium]